MVSPKFRFSLPIMPTLFFIFVIAKLFGAIGWSWWWVTAPLWGPFAILFGLFGIFMSAIGVFMLIAWIFSKIE